MRIIEGLVAVGACKTGDLPLSCVRGVEGDCPKGPGADDEGVAARGDGVLGVNELLDLSCFLCNSYSANLAKWNKPLTVSYIL